MYAVCSNNLCNFTSPLKETFMTLAHDNQAAMRVVIIHFLYSQSWCGPAGRYCPYVSRFSY